MLAVHDPSPSAHVMAPRESGAHLLCPRCTGRLFVEGDDLTCLACGYTYGWGDGARVAHRPRVVPSRPEEELTGSVARAG